MNAGQFRTKENTAPASDLLAGSIGPGDLTGNWASRSIAGAPGVTTITEAQFDDGDVIDATDVRAGDRLLWRVMDDDGTHFYGENVTYAYAGVDANYRRVVTVETERKPGGYNVITFRGSQQVGITPERPEEEPVNVGSLRDGHRSEDLSLAEPTCTCATNNDGTKTTMLCPSHADTDPCLTISQVTGRRRKGTIRRGRCTNCGWREPALS